MANEKKLERAIEAIGLEYGRATSKFPPFNSAHEGHAVLMEEVDELWEEIKRRDRNDDALFKEAVQVASMALRFITDVCLKSLPQQEP